MTQQTYDQDWYAVEGHLLRVLQRVQRRLADITSLKPGEKFDLGKDLLYQLENHVFGPITLTEKSGEMPWGAEATNEFLQVMNKDRSGDLGDNINLTEEQIVGIMEGTLGLDQIPETVSFGALLSRLGLETTRPGELITPQPVEDRRAVKGQDVPNLDVAPPADPALDSPPAERSPESAELGLQTES